MGRAWSPREFAELHLPKVMLLGIIMRNAKVASNTLRTQFENVADARGTKLTNAAHDKVWLLCLLVTALVGAWILEQLVGSEVEYSPSLRRMCSQLGCKTCHMNTLGRDGEADGLG